MTTNRANLENIRDDAQRNLECTDKDWAMGYWIGQIALINDLLLADDVDHAPAR